MVQYTGANNPTWTPSVTLYDYAVSGAVCSNTMIQRTIKGLNGQAFLFPDVDGYEVPAFLADKSSNRNGTSTPYFQPPLTADNSVYTMWIGTNDLGSNAFLTNSQTPGDTIADYIDCVFAQLKRLYDAGARHFVLFNIAPLELAPMYSNSSVGAGGGVQASDFPGGNLTERAEKMKEEATGVNDVFEYRVPYESKISGDFDGASWALFDVYSLVSQDS